MKQIDPKPTQCNQAPKAISLLQQGVTLLEMMLVLSFVATIMILVTRYYDSTNHSKKIVLTLKSIQAIYSAEQQYCNEYDCSTTSNTPPNIKNFQANGLISDNLKDHGTANPWGEIDDATIASNYLYSASFGDVPEAACSALKNMIDSNYNSQSTTNINVTCLSSPCATPKSTSSCMQLDIK